MSRTALSALAFLLIAGSLSVYAQNALAPTGTLRAAFLGDNPVLGTVDAKSGAITGPVADMVKEMARRMNVPYKLLPAAGARDIIERLQVHTADIGFMAYNAGRAKDVDFSQAWLLMPNSYLVRADSPIHASADADKPGVMIAAVKGDTQDVYLSAHLTNAKIKALPALPPVNEMEKMLTSGEVAAFAANKQRLIQVADQFATLRVVPDSYFVAGQAIAIAHGDPSNIESLKKLVDEVLATDVVKQSVTNAGLKGVDAARPGNQTR